jgi:hypothetical protein
MKTILFLCLFSIALFAQDALPTAASAVPEAQAQAQPQPLPTPALSKEEEMISLRALNDSITRREKQRDDIYIQMQAAKDPIERDKLVPELTKINEEIATLSHRFQAIAVHTDISAFEEEPEKEFNWQEELGQLLQPLMAEMKAATKDSRELGELNEQLAINQERRKTAAAALNSLEPLINEATDPELVSRLQDLQSTWQGRLDDAVNQITVTEIQLKQRQTEKESLLERSKGMASGFVRTRGLNLLLGVLALLGVFLGMRGVQILWTKIHPSRKKGRSFSARLTSLVWTILSVILAVGAMVATFNATGDWFLLSLTILFLLGIGWAGMKTLPGMVDQFRMMLNMGAVREDERLMYDGLPWKVNAISFRTELINPLLDGGVLTLPTRMLMAHLSRPPGNDEEWFPSKKDDWVLLSDGTFGKVGYQCPSTVQVVKPGGSQKVYNTLQYLELAPTVLSTGYRREVFFGVDYNLIGDAIANIPEKMQACLQNVLEAKLGENLQHLDVQLAEAADSSLKFCIVVDCKGGAAPQWFFIPMWVQAALVDLCNQNQWTIPFPQLQVHTDK